MNYKNQIKSIILGLVLAVGISFAGATWTAPTASPVDNGTASAPIDTSASDQAKAGTLAIASTAAATSPYKLDVIGYILSTGLAVAGGADIEGSIKADTLISTGSQKVCADSDGVLELCAGDTLSIVYQSDAEIYIPTNVTAMTVEIWGGGGGNDSSVNSDGGDTTFYWSGSFANKVIAKGGKKGSGTIGGAGGTYTTPTYSKFTYVTQTNGGNGGNATSSSSPTGSGCPSLFTGGTGGSGGEGGASAGVSGVSGGAGGDPGSMVGVTCGSSVMNVGSYGSDGTTPTIYGVGGSGFGGTGGYSGDSYLNDPLFEGQDGHAGGGGAGYVKFDVTVNPGEVYIFTVGRYGEGLNQWPYGKSAPSDWPLGGQGAQGAVKITYTL